MGTRSKLAVILHADVVGSTALVQENELLAHEAIQGSFRHFSQVISSYSGTAREIRGDALVAEFGRASDAVLAALAFQGDSSIVDLTAAGGAAGPALRVGIALGEVIVADGTVTGAGVVLAQRIEQLAEPYAVCISSAIREALPKRLPVVAESLGERSLKGFAEETTVYRVRIEDGQAIPPPAPFEDDSPTRPTERAQRPTLIVLPFTTRGTNEDDEVLCDGIAEDLTTALSSVRWLMVMARPVALEIGHRTTDVKQIGEELGVRYVLTGSVRRVSNRVRVTAQLNDARSGAQLWSRRYDRVLEDLFELQDELALSIAAEIAPELARTDVGILSSAKAENLDAWKAYQQGLAHLHRNDPEGFSNARTYLMRAIALDPGFGSAYSALAYVAWHELLRGLPSADGQPATLESVLQPAEQALSLDAHDGAANVVMGLAHMAQGNHEAAMAGVQRGIEVAPSSVFGYMARAMVNAFGEHDAEATLDDLDFVGQLSPSATTSDAFSPMRLPVRAYAHLTLGNYGEAATTGEAALRAGSFYGPMTACVAHRCLGNHERAGELIALMLERNPKVNAALVRSRLAFFGDHDALDWFLNELVMAGMPEGGRQ